MVEFAQSQYRPSHDVDCTVSIGQLSWPYPHLDASLQGSDCDASRVLQPALSRQRTDRRNAGTEDEGEELRYAACRRLQELLDLHRAKVEGLARELAERRELDQVAIEQVLTAMADKGWAAPSTTLNPLPDGRELRTLRDAGQYIAKLPKREHDAPEWRAAIEALMLVVEGNGQALLAPSCGRCIEERPSPEPARRKKGREDIGLSDNLPRAYEQRR